jgi:hypothetical protein
MPERKFRKGDRVAFRLGPRLIQGVIKEDRGPIGVKARHLYLIEFHLERQSDSVSEVELPADDLETVEVSAASRE